jgi:CRISPR/Cas system-associated exonuclease Cas4 (RecB family)
MQLALAALCLRERFPQAVISRGAIFFVGSRRRREVVLDEETLNKAENLALEVGKKVSKGLFPRDFPALKDDRCEGCCFRPLCFL